MRLKGSITPSPRPIGIVSRADAGSIPTIENAELTTVINDLAFLETYGDGGMVFETTANKLRNYVIYGNNTGNLDSETGKYKIPITVRKINHFDAETAVVYSLYPDRDSVVKASNSTKQRSIIVEVEPDTHYLFYSTGSVANAMGRVACFETEPQAGDTALALFTTSTPPENKFITTSSTHYVMIYISWGVDDISGVLPGLKLIKGSADFDSTIAFTLDEPLGIGEELRYADTGIDIPTPVYGDCRLTVDTDTAPFDVWIQYDTKEVPLRSVQA